MMNVTSNDKNLSDTNAHVNQPKEKSAARKIKHKNSNKKFYEQFLEPLFLTLLVLTLAFVSVSDGTLLTSM